MGMRCLSRYSELTLSWSRNRLSSDRGMLTQVPSMRMSLSYSLCTGNFWAAGDSVEGVSLGAVTWPPAHSRGSGEPAEWQGDLANANQLKNYFCIKTVKRNMFFLGNLTIFFKHIWNIGIGQNRLQKGNQKFGTKVKSFYNDFFLD